MWLLSALFISRYMSNFHSQSNFIYMMQFNILLDKLFYHVKTTAWKNSLFSTRDILTPLWPFPIYILAFIALILEMINLVLQTDGVDTWKLRKEFWKIKQFWDLLVAMSICHNYVIILLQPINLNFTVTWVNSTDAN